MHTNTSCTHARRTYLWSLTGAKSVCRDCGADCTAEVDKRPLPTKAPAGYVH